MPERQWTAGLQGLDGDVAAHLSHDRQSQKLAHEKALIALEVGHDDFNEIICRAGNHVAGNDLVQSDDCILEGLGLLVGVSRNLDLDWLRWSTAR
jgi:hypothetical protein